MSNLKIVFCALAGCIVLASCQSNRALNQGGTVTPNLRPANDLSSINGKWIPSDVKERKVYYNEFKDGNFVGRSPDGKTTIAAGTYKFLQNGDMQMSWESAARKERSIATCKRLTEREMQCTFGTSVFNLQRA